VKRAAVYMLRSYCGKVVVVQSRMAQLIGWLKEDQATCNMKSRASSMLRGKLYRCLTGRAKDTVGEVEAMLAKGCSA
jgi:hypothetical protein